MVPLDRVYFTEHFGMPFSFFSFVDYFLLFLEVGSILFGLKTWVQIVCAAKCTREISPRATDAGPRGHVGSHADATAHRPVQREEDRVLPRLFSGDGEHGSAATARARVRDGAEVAVLHRGDLKTAVRLPQGHR